jgi:hypothetical protein
MCQRMPITARAATASRLALLNYLHPLRVFPFHTGLFHYDVMTDTTLCGQYLGFSTMSELGLPTNSYIAQPIICLSARLFGLIRTRRRFRSTRKQVELLSPPVPHDCILVHSTTDHMLGHDDRARHRKDGAMVLRIVRSHNADRIVSCRS